MQPSFLENVQQALISQIKGKKKKVRRLTGIHHQKAETRETEKKEKMEWEKSRWISSGVRATLEKRDLQFAKSDEQRLDVASWLRTDRAL